MPQNAEAAHSFFTVGLTRENPLNSGVTGIDIADKRVGTRYKCAGHENIPQFADVKDSRVAVDEHQRTHSEHACHTFQYC